jgi:tetratricopeptide (TPR) repeat protein
MGSYARRARLRLREGQSSKAVQDYNAALTRGDSVQLYLARGRLLEQLGRRAEAAAGYEEGVQATGGAVLLREAAAELALKRGNHDRALRHVAALIEHARVDTRWELMRGRILQKAGRPDQAREARERALKSAGGLLEVRRSAAAFMSRGRARLALGQREAAIADLQRALQQAPHLQRARALLERAQQGQAEGEPH